MKGLSRVYSGAADPMKYAYSFDKDYYDRFYGVRRPRKEDREEMALLGDFVCAYLRYLGESVQTVLDIGCGLGLWREAISRHFPKARYHGVEVSRYLCRTYGWTYGSVADFRGRPPSDLVICKDVLQYLPSAEATAAIDNLVRLSRYALYFGVLTKEDWEENCDQAQTNGEVYQRSAVWYRRRLMKHFINLGGGLFLRRDARVVVWELEKLS